MNESLVGRVLADDEALSQQEAEKVWVFAFNEIAAGIEAWADRKGWNEDDPERFRDAANKHSLVHDLSGFPEFIDKAIIAYDLSKICLMGTELAEAAEGRRHGDPKSDKIPDFTAQEEEFADAIIRMMHHAAHRKLRVAEALVAKLAYNEKRPYKHGKLA